MKPALLCSVFLFAWASLSAQESSPPESSGNVRHSMLQWHQTAGFALWGLWLATNIKGEEAIRSLKRTQEPAANVLLLANPSQNWPLYYLAMNRSEWHSRRGGSAHRSLAGLTVGAYALTAGLSLLAPSRDVEYDGFDSVSAHKLLALVHFAAIASMPSLGKRIEHKGPRAARQMQNAGWAGFTALSASIVVFYF